MHCLCDADYYMIDIFTRLSTKNPLMNVKLSFTVGKVETFRFLDSNGAEKNHNHLYFDRSIEREKRQINASLSFSYKKRTMKNALFMFTHIILKLSLSIFFA